VESRELAEAAEQFSHREQSTVPAATDGVLSVQTAMAEVDGRRVEVRVLRPEPGYRELARRRRERAAGSGRGDRADVVVSPMQGTVLDVRVREGDAVEAGAVICVVEAMKMENEVTAHRGGVVSELSVSPGGTVVSGQVVCVVSDGATPA
jgi:acetyl-CoA/propionyl-CoA carboxylase biotin carboxyl carrier protein